MKTDEILRQDVSISLRWEPQIAACDIKVIANNGVVTLNGIVHYFSKKIEAEDIAKKVAGVKSIINLIELTTNSWEEKKDIEITVEILNAFLWNWNSLNDTIKVNVLNAWVTLSGELEWNYQKEAAREAVANLIGVKGINNNIMITSKKNCTVDRINLELALQNHLALDTKNLEVEVTDSNITLKGTVDSWYHKELAGRIAWKAQGVINVDNQLLIE